jgi:hypothetical protein
VRKLELAPCQGLLETREELATEDPTERLDVEQEVVAGRDPVSVVKRQGSAWDQTVEVEMRTESLIPGVEYGQKAELAAEVSAPKVEQRLRDGLKQEMEKRLFVGEDQWVELVRERENQMEVTDRKQFCLTLIQPAGFLQ